MSLRDEVSYTDPYSSYDSSCCQIGQGTLYGGGGRGTDRGLKEHNIDLQSELITKHLS